MRYKLCSQSTDNLERIFWPGKDMDLLSELALQNEVLHKTAEALKTKHHFTSAYYAQINGSVEVVCREVIRGTRALLSEYNRECRIGRDTPKYGASGYKPITIPKDGKEYHTTDCVRAAVT